MRCRAKDIARRRASITARASQASRSERRISRNSARSALSSRRLEDSRIEFANLQIGFQLAYYRVRLFRLKAGGKGINVDTPRKAGGLLQRLVSHCLRCCSLPCIQSLPFRPPSTSPVRFLWFRVKVKLDKWMLMLNINHLLRLIINLTSDSKQTFHLCNSSVLSSFTFSPPLRGNFVMHFIYSQRQILIYRGDMASVRCISRPAKSLYESTLAATLSSAIEEGRKRERERTAVLLGTPKL